VSISTDRNVSLRQLRVDQRRVPSLRVLMNGSTTGLPSRRAMWIVRISCVTDDAIFRMHYEFEVMMSLLRFELTTFYYYFLLLLLQRSTVLSHHSSSSNMVRQAGTAPATGATIYCLSSLWCIVTYKHCSVMDTANRKH